MQHAWSGICCSAGEELIQAFATPEYLNGKSLLKAALQLHQSKHSHSVGTEHLVVDSMGMGQSIQAGCSAGSSPVSSWGWR